MRTTLDIDSDVLEAAKELARKEKSSAGAVISYYARRGLAGDSSSVSEAAAQYGDRLGVPILPATGTIVSEASIRRIRDDAGI